MTAEPITVFLIPLIVSEHDHCSLENSDQAEVNTRAPGGRADVWSVLVIIREAYYQAGGLFRGFQRLDRASGSHERALSIWRELDNRVKEGLTLSTLGAVYGSLKQNEKAIDRFN
jgi:hypothetical protein